MCTDTLDTHTHTPFKPRDVQSLSTEPQMCECPAELCCPGAVFYLNRVRTVGVETSASWIDTSAAKARNHCDTLHLGARHSLP